MSIVTKGLGSSSLITEGYGFLQLIKRIVKKVISRILPFRRKRFKMTIKIYGDVIHPYQETIQVKGVKDFSPILFILIDDEDMDSMNKEELRKEIEFLDKLLEDGQ